MKRGVSAFRRKAKGVHRPLPIRIENRQVGVRTFGDPALRELEDARGLAGQFCDRLLQRQRPRCDKRAQRQSERRLRTDHAEWGHVELLFLILNGVRGMVCGDHINGPVAEAGQDRLPVRLGPKRRVHFCVGIEPADRLLRQREVVRCGLTAHPDPASFGLADQTDRFCRADVGDVEPGAGQLRQQEIPRHHRRL